MAKHKKPYSNPQQIAPHLKTASNCFRSQNYAKAIELWEDALTSPALPPAQQPHIRTALAEAYFRYGLRQLFEDQAAGCRMLEQAATLLEADALYAYHSGLAYHRAGNINDAVKWYEEAKRRDPNFSRVHYPLALALAEQGKKPSKAPVWKSLTEIEQKRISGTPGGDPLSQGLAAAQQDLWETAESLLQAALADDQSGLALYYLGVIAQRQQRVEEALQHWQAAYDLGLSSPHLLSNLLLGYVLMAENALMQGSSDEAHQWVKRGTALDEQHPRLREIQTYVALQEGYVKAEQGNWQAALKLWEQVTESSGANARILAANTAIAYEKLEKWHEAAEAWRDYLGRRPKKTDAEGWMPPEQVAKLWARISALYMRSEQGEEAITTLKHALKYQPDDVVLGQALVRALAREERFDAAKNQVNRVLKQYPNNAETMALKAELAEVAPRGFFLFNTIPALREWEEVLATNDEVYAPLAKQRLVELYEQAYMEGLQWGFNIKGSLQYAEKALELKPDYHFLRALYVDGLLHSKAKKKQIEEQVALIDLQDQEALHQLIDAFHTANNHRRAAELLAQADQLQRLDTKFYLGIASCASQRKQDNFAEQYLNEALSRAEDDKERHVVRTTIGINYMTAGNEAEAEKIWRTILKEDRKFGLAHQMMGMLYMQRGDTRTANDHFRQAEKWAKEHNHLDLLEQIQRIRFQMNNPFMFPPMFGDFEDDDDFDLDDFDDLDEDFLNDLPNILPKPPKTKPITDRRRRRKR